MTDQPSTLCRDFFTWCGREILERHTSFESCQYLRATLLLPIPVTYTGAFRFELQVLDCQVEAAEVP